jgi:hypothetical protein
LTLDSANAIQRRLVAAATHSKNFVKVFMEICDLLRTFLLFFTVLGEKMPSLLLKNIWLQINCKIPNRFKTHQAAG